MPSLFCMRCKSLTPPGSERCKVCGASLNGTGDVPNGYEDPDMRRPNERNIQGSASVKQRTDERKLLSKENAPAPYFPYEPRESQMDIVRDITTTLARSDHIVMESGTGTGKTICALAGALHHAKMKGKRVIYLTRTISQSDQVMRELKAISSLRPVSGLTLAGRKRSCPLLRTISGYEDLMPHVLANLCEEKKAKSLRGGGGGCRYYERVKSSVIGTEEYCRSNFPTSDELDALCESSDVCPYEMRKALMQGMDVIVAPYVHILSEDIRSNLLAHMRCDDEDILLIVDEAHNLIPAAREQESFTIKVKDVDAAITEADEMKNTVLLRDITARDMLGFLKGTIRNIANERLPLGKPEALIEHDLIESRLKERYSMSHSDLMTAMDRMIEIGETRTEILLDRGVHRLSDLYVLGISLKDWISSKEGQFIKTVRTEKDGEMLCACCIDPKDITMFIRSLNGSVHMSGTLQPLEQYARTMGLPQTSVKKIYPTPFPPENRSVIYVNDVTTKFEDLKRQGMMERIASHIIRLCNAVERNTLVFFPSYGLMQKIRPMVETEIRKNMYWEESGYQKRTMASLDMFRKGRNGVFFTVMGGSIAEGIDFPGDELAFAIIVGMPFPPPTIESGAMSDMFDKKYGAGIGWAYVSEVPTLRKIKQAIGRLIRTETDRGMAVILDSRVSRYMQQLGARLSDDPVRDAMNFFNDQ